MNVYTDRHVNSILILDTGAPDHMICDSAFYCNMLQVVDIDISLPTGDQTKATLIGTVRISDDLSLENVLFAPAFGSICFLYQV